MENEFYASTVALCSAQREDPIVRHVCVYEIYFSRLFANRMEHLCSLSDVHQLNLCMDLAGSYFKLLHSLENNLKWDNLCSIPLLDQRSWEIKYVLVITRSRSSCQFSSFPSLFFFK